MLSTDGCLGSSVCGQPSQFSTVLQAAQVRKSSFMPAAGVVRAHSYHPETHHYCTVHAGTFVKQVSLAECFKS